jgi:serine/threonine protein kinase
MRLGEFEIRRVLGIGGFGIVYLAFDHALEREVALKEYMPSSLAGRTDDNRVSLRSQSDQETFDLGLRSFVNEARLLARFDNPALVKVYRYWEDYGTAYMAMPYYFGENLKSVRQRLTAPPDEAWIRAIVIPLLSAIELLHSDRIYHRDISPDNVIIQPDGRPVLLDLGAARRVISDKSMALTAILKPAYAPIEQYAEAGAVKQGPWTDLYSLGATMYFLLFGRAPSPATTRAVHDDMVPLAERGAPGCSRPFLQAIDWMLRPRPTERPQSVAELRAVLESGVPPPLPVPEGAGSWDRTMLVPPPPGPSTQALELDLTEPPPRRAAPADATYEPTMRVAPPRPAPPAPTLLDRAAGQEDTMYVPRPGAQDYAPTMRVGPPGAGPPAPPTAAPASPQAFAAGAGDRSVAAEPKLAPRNRWLAPVLLALVAAGGAGAWWVTSGSKPKPVTSAAPPAASAPATAATAAPGPAPASAPAPATPVVAPAPPQAPKPVPAEAKPAVAKPPAAAAEPKPGPAAAPATARKDPAVPPYMPPAPAVAASRPTATSPAAAASRPTPVTATAPSATGTPTLGAALAPGGGERPAPSATTSPAIGSGGGGTAAAPGTGSQAARPATEPEPVLRTRLLSPSERCGGRVLMALWNCIERQCSRSPELKDHPECIEARQQQYRRQNP